LFFGIVVEVVRVGEGEEKIAVAHCEYWVCPEEEG
jgi:hypothetical protein